MRSAWSQSKVTLRWYLSLRRQAPLPDFKEHPKVIDGFSDLMVEVFGDSGRGARAAVGMMSLSKQVAVEVEIVLEAK